MSIESELRELMMEVAAADSQLADRLAAESRHDADAEVEGISKGVLTTVDLLRIRGRMDGLREAVLVLARELDALKTKTDAPAS